MREQNLYLSGITPESIVDGPGLRYVIFTQGCLHHCPGCHNPESWDINGGKEFSVKEIIRMIKKQMKIQGVTFSGGEPFLQAEGLAHVALAVHQTGLDVVTYTGFTYEELIEKGKTDGNINSLLCATDLLIDGKYIHKKRAVDLPFRGSSNQRIIDVVKTRENGQIMLMYGD
ncbi:MAG: anaerobic ribonucleoside-triphosphate reductase activating protein [Treponema sp.]|jgi:anaerobic ribonucleoside-triphosphate reductase activating protein|nr:anaerobic ribonucleoside-triphosphate reductase activating protein [Treponema sp.]